MPGLQAKGRTEGEHFILIDCYNAIYNMQRKSGDGCRCRANGDELVIETEP